jgi:dienelactone hydrolase
MNRFGAFDMAGNVKEWCWNSSDGLRRYILGGAWNESVYMFNDPDSQPAFDRRATYGFRCVKYSSGESLVSVGSEQVPLPSREYDKEKPVADAKFDTYRRLYAYDKTDLEARIDSVDDRNPDWRRENVSFTAGYGNERLPASLFIPKMGHPPYQAVVVFPGSGALRMRSSDQMDVQRFEWIMKSGRVAIQPIYKSTFERGDGLLSIYPNRTASYRDHVIAWAREASRAIDYLEMRNDVAADYIAYVGFSWGAAMGPIFVALEPRFKACILVMGGFFQQSALPEADAFNFASRVKAPVLLLSGRYDFYFPTDTSQLPMFRLFNVPEDQKRRIEYETGHIIPRTEQIRESLNWLDRHLGPVR